MTEKELIILNVGGRKFETYKSTLTNKSTYFQALLGNNFGDLNDKSKTEGIFIDRDPDNFSEIMKYLRDPLHVISKKISYELAFYGIDYEDDKEMFDDDKLYSKKNKRKINEKEDNDKYEKYIRGLEINRRIINYKLEHDLCIVLKCPLKSKFPIDLCEYHCN